MSGLKRVFLVLFIGVATVLPALAGGAAAPLSTGTPVEVIVLLKGPPLSDTAGRARLALASAAATSDLREIARDQQVVAARIVDELLPPIEMAGCTARIFELAQQAGS